MSVAVWVLVAVAVVLIDVVALGAGVFSSSLSSARQPSQSPRSSRRGNNSHSGLKPRFGSTAVAERAGGRVSTCSTRRTGSPS